ncbi:MAG: hypothetical protein QOD66_3609 [Solirubrobacteraceae bacterium]|jgi:hypothetical protein|nr:hypothetical protein [Solirubrobacteraceae bacterium]
MPASIEITTDFLTVHIEGADKLWALKSRLQIPLANVISAQPARTEATGWLHGMRVGGTHIPGVISAGRFYSHGELVFWDVHEMENAIAIQLLDERYDKLVIEVENPDQDIVRIREAVLSLSTLAAPV